MPDRKVCDLAAGESWCPTTGRCLQLALEACPTTVSQRRPSIGGASDAKGCLIGGGYVVREKLCNSDGLWGYVNMGEGDNEQQQQPYATFS